MTAQKIIIIALILAIVFICWLANIGHYLNLAFIQQNLATFKTFYAEHTLLTLLGFFMAYVVIIALSIPGAVLMTLLAGALFGITIGTVLVSFASNLGAMLAFLTSRYLLRETVQRRFGRFFDTINTGIERDGSFYLFTLRLVPAFPFFAINLLMGLTKIRTWTFYWVSQIGMLAGTIVYINAGRALGSLNHIGEIATPSILLSFALLGIFPWIVKALLKRYRPTTESKTIAKESS